MPRAKANEIEMYYEEAGRGPEPVVFIHGYTASRAHWIDIIRRLPLDRLRTFAFDLRGGGRSDRPASGHNIVQYADDVADAMRNLGIETFHYVGHSMGGLIGMYLGLRHPHRLRTLILVAPVPSEGLNVPDELRLTVRDACADGQKYWAFLLTVAGRPLSEEMVQTFIQHYEAPSEENLEQSWESMKQTNIASRLGEITVPTLMVTGDRDVNRGASLADAARIPNCALQVFYRVGHQVPHEVPQEFADLVVEFIEHGVALPLDLQQIASQSSARAELA